MTKLAFLFPLLSGVSWGSAGIFIRQISDFGFNSVTMLSSRVFVGSIMMFFVILFTKKEYLKIRMKDFWLFFLAAVLGTMAMNLCYNISLNTLTLSLASLLMGIAPIYVLIMAAIIFKEKLTRKKVICMIIAAAGCVMVSGVLEESGGISLDTMGLILGVISGFSYAVYSIFSKLIAERGYHALTITFYCSFICAVVSAPFTDWQILGSAVAERPFVNSVWIALYALFVGVLPYILYNISFKYMEAGKASILAMSEPVTAMIFGIIIYSEIPSVIGFAGMILTIAALIIMSLPDKNPPANITEQLAEDSFKAKSAADL